MTFHWERSVDETIACTCLHLPDGAIIRDPSCAARTHRPEQS